MSLASKLPWTHRFAGGFPGLSSQPLPTDADAIDYLTRVKAADGAGVETGVAVAVDAFFRDTKASGVFDALKACCILAGARTLAGALVPVVGDAPTNVADGFVEGDYIRTSGLTGDGATTYLDSGRDNNADGQNDRHWAFFSTTALSNNDCCFGADFGGTFANSQVRVGADNYLFCSSPSGTAANGAEFANSGEQGFHGASRDNSASFVARSAGAEIEKTVSSATPPSINLFVFARNTTSGALNHASTRLAFYSIGTSLSLEDLDTAVTDLITAIGEAL
jgi:hypothetical protein